MREAIGFNATRGDSLSVSDAPFRVAAVPVPEELPLWRQPEVQSLARGLAPWLALPLVALVVVFGVLRPTLRGVRKKAATGPLVDARVDGPVDLPTPVNMARTPVGPPQDGPTGGTGDVPLLPTAEAAAQQARARKLEGIRELARQNPATVANVVRNWVSQPGS